MNEGTGGQAGDQPDGRTGGRAGERTDGRASGRTMYLLSEGDELFITRAAEAHFTRRLGRRAAFLKTSPSNTIPMQIYS